MFRLRIFRHRKIHHVFKPLQEIQKQRSYIFILKRNYRKMMQLRESFILTTG